MTGLNNQPSKREIRRAGKAIVNPNSSEEERRDALKKIEFWRGVHLEPLRTAMDLIESICGTDETTIFVSRLKRIDTIIDKLGRNDTSHKLDTLCDIAGCRLIVQDIDAAYEIKTQIESLLAELSFADLDPSSHDYIADQKSSGYKGIHLIARFDSERYDYVKLRVEIQIRTMSQHVWATAVEAYDLVLDRKIKFGIGSEKEMEFFRIASLILDEVRTISSKDLQNICEINSDLHILENLEAANDSMFSVGNVEIKRSDVCLVEVQRNTQELYIETYAEEEADAALDEYNRRETDEHNKSIYVLARAGSLAELKRAFSNFYFDTHDFVSCIRTAISDQA